MGSEKVIYSLIYGKIMKKPTMIVMGFFKRNFLLSIHFEPSFLCSVFSLDQC